MPAAKTRTQSPRKATKVTPKSKRKQAARSDSESSEGSETEYNSDALDDDEPEPKKTNKRKRGAEREKKTRSPKKKQKKNADEDYDEEEVELEDGQEIVGVVVQAPKTGLVPKGCVSQNTFDFLSQLKDPKCNDREWFKLHDPVFRQAEKEWQGFIEVFTDLLVEADDQIPPLPPKDVVHRIYRDVRFSNDKTPYKTNFSASFSRSGRKGIFAFYHVMIKPGNQSIIAAGSWCPGKNELATIRSNILRSPTRLRQIISNPVFVGHFGEPKPGERRNIFGREDELKVAPKGIAKDHADIDLLKCRSFCVARTFTDAEVLSSDFKNTLVEMVGVLRPLVHCLNDMMTIPPDEDEDEDEE
ncbi:hypothetical protein FB45DRAFT_918896 [Roridomyces roridus]|uniref:TIGR02453 family protein n=1 Tax=Roridomyces roridus TaxID=1738132 RepID=A0AAD7FK22_9AGAR|nr:hypothetical protein FB45DRAFT_918896 [Roridomyces roridus]